MDTHKDGKLDVMDETAIQKYLTQGISLPEIPTEKN